MTLLRLGAAFLAVAVLFAALARLTGSRGRGAVVLPLVEALVLTLFSALWFGSLGNGGWVLVYALLGVLASGTDRWTAALRDGGPLRAPFIATLVVTVRYVAAGGLLALIIG